MVVASLRLSIMHISLELDHDPLTGAIEIHDEPMQHVLAPKLQIQNPAIAQQRPRMTFGRSGMQPQLAGARVSLGRSETTQRIHRLSVANSGVIYATKVLRSGPKKLALRSPSPERRGGQGGRTREGARGGGLATGFSPRREPLARSARRGQALHFRRQLAAPYFGARASGLRLLEPPVQIGQLRLRDRKSVV